MGNKEIYYNYIEDDWTNCSTNVEDAAEYRLLDFSLDELKDVKTIKLYKGVKEEQWFNNFLCVDRILEGINECAGEVCGECAEDYLWYVTSEQQKELEDLINGWADKHKLHPSFFLIGNCEEFDYEVPKHLIEEILKSFEGFHG